MLCNLRIYISGK